MMKTLWLLLALALLASLAPRSATAAGDDHPPPVIAPAFRASLRSTSATSTAPPSSYLGTLLNDNNLGAANYDLLGTLAGYPLHVISYPRRSGTYYKVNGICRNLPFNSTYHPLFSWVPYSQYIGAEVIRGVNCDVFNLFTAVPLPDGVPGKATSNLTLWSHNVDHVDVPMRFVNELIYTNEPNSFSSTSEMDFFTFEPVSSFPASTFELPSICTSTDPVGFYCNSTDPNGIRKTSVYNFHKPTVASLLNQNTADVIGDAYFICEILTGKRPGSTVESEYLSLWDVTMNSTYGQYCQCNEGPNAQWVCTGGNTLAVGREAPDDIVLPAGGQCTHHPKVGEWFSLPAQCACSPDQRIGENGCAWRAERLRKTISGQCLVDNGMRAACEKENHFPFSYATQVMVRAMNSELPSQGGCPAIDLSSLGVSNAERHHHNAPEKQHSSVHPLVAQLFAQHHRLF